VAKKEDPTSHERFLAVLQRLYRPDASAAGTQDSTSLLSRGLLVELFWLRMSESLQDVAADKARHFSSASSRAYPLLRRAAVEVLRSMQDWADQGSAGAVGPFGNAELDSAQEVVEVSSEGGDATARGAGMFGSSLWTKEDMLACGAASAWSWARSSAVAPKAATALAQQGAGGQSGEAEPKEHSLVAGLRPMRDKYLHLAFQRMSAPIAQMFPELEGYTGIAP
jgi:hypothetical protein